MQLLVAEPHYELEPYDGDEYADYDDDYLDYNNGVYNVPVDGRIKGGADKRRDAFDELFTPHANSPTVRGASVLGLAVASVVFVGVLVLLTAILLRHRRSVAGKQPARPQIVEADGGAKRKQFVLSGQVKPVVSCKTAAGPAGLKNSPSPVQTPETCEVGRQPQLSASLSRSATPNLQMSPIDDAARSGTPCMEPMEGGGQVKEAAATAGGADTTSTDGSGIGGAQCHGNGVVHVSLHYMADKEALVVTVVKAEQLKPPAAAAHSPQQEGGGSVEAGLDPYVKLQLLPEKQHKAKTRVVRNTCEPSYDEEFTFYGLTKAQIQSSTLHMAVVAFDRFSRDETIGEAICALHEYEALVKGDKAVAIQAELHSRTSKYSTEENRGELLVSLCHQPAGNTLTAVVLKAKHLPKFDVSGMADPYVKVHMMCEGQRVAKKKTHVKKRTLQPVYNESFVFELPAGDSDAVAQVSFEFTVMDWDRVTKNEVMGRCAIGASARDESGKKHWLDVVQQPRRQIAQWHRLRP